MKWLVMLSALAAAGALLAWSASRCRTAAELADAAEARLVAVAAQAAQLDTLHRAAPPESRRTRPAPGMSARLAAAAAEAGLPHGVLQSVSPEAETAIGTAFRRTAMRVTLDPVSLPGLGRFLNEWRTAEPAWNVSAIDLTPTPVSSRKQAAHGTQRPLRASLLIECFFAAKEPARERP